MKVGIRNVIPRWIIIVWITIGAVMLGTSMLWEITDLVEDCFSITKCLIFDIMMFVMHYIGIALLVLGTFILIGNENIGTKLNS